jgi:hypothetical protein
LGSRPTGSYVARHWRGDLSLGISYWINCVLLGGMFGVVAHVVFEILAGGDRSPLQTRAFLVVLWVAILVLATWQFVGTWRSAGKHTSRGGRNFWAETVRIVLALGLAGFASTLLRSLGVL